MPSRFAPVTNKEISQLSKQAMKKVTKFGLEVLTAKALSFWLEFIDKTGKKVCCLQMQIILKSCIFLVDLFINKLKTKFNNPFEETSPQELNKRLQKFYLSPRKSDDRGRWVIARQNCNRWQQ